MTDIKPSMKVTCKKPTALDIILHRALHPINTGVEPIFSKEYFRTIKLKPDKK